MGCGIFHPACAVLPGGVLTPILAGPNCARKTLAWTVSTIPGSWRTISFMPTAKIKPSIYQLKITLLGIQPPIWRRILVPSTMPLCCLHDALQAVLGWTDSHLHQFEKDGKY